MLKGECYDEKVDVYAFGVMMWELVSREDFFGGEKFMFKVEKRIVEGERKPIPPSSPPLYSSLLEKCWGGEARERPSFRECLKQLVELKEKLCLHSINLTHSLPLLHSLPKLIPKPSSPTDWVFPSSSSLRSLAWSPPQLDLIFSLDGNVVGSKKRSKRNNGPSHN